MVGLLAGLAFRLGGGLAGVVVVGGGEVGGGGGTLGRTAGRLADGAGPTIVLGDGLGVAA